ncbi:hypothetical protein GY45DRAFT_1324946 [Cubamyces sp. BRFM 1775]|nr:hypothetical protein GY45DRAFT_1324946 [Cubamyces sp. BRFM 1775]
MTRKGSHSTFAHCSGQQGRPGRLQHKWLHLLAPSAISDNSANARDSALTQRRV